MKKPKSKKDLYEKLIEALSALSGSRALGDYGEEAIEAEIINVVERHTGKRLVKSVLKTIRVLE